MIELHQSFSVSLMVEIMEALSPTLKNYEIDCFTVWLSGGEWQVVAQFKTMAHYPMQEVVVMRHRGGDLTSENFKKTATDLNNLFNLRQPAFVF